MKTEVRELTVEELDHVAGASGFWGYVVAGALGGPIGALVGDHADGETSAGQGAKPTH